MRKKLLLKASLFFGSALFAQNQTPVISNFAASVNSTLKQVTVTFDVSDNENDLLDIYL